MGRKKTRRKTDRSISVVRGRAIATRSEARLGEVIMQTKKKPIETHDHGAKRPAGEQSMGTEIYEELQKLIREISKPVLSVASGEARRGVEGPAAPKPSAAGA
jgi:hypothetical protein